MKTQNDILESILEISLRLKPLSFLLSHFSHQGSADLDDESLRAIGQIIGNELKNLENIHRALEIIWKNQ